MNVSFGKYITKYSISDKLDQGLLRKTSVAEVTKLDHGISETCTRNSLF